jgi:hypothetical protein
VFRDGHALTLRPSQVGEHATRRSLGRQALMIPPMLQSHCDD